MPLGKNVPLQDTLIRKTTNKTNNINSRNNRNIKDNTPSTNSTNRLGQPSTDPKDLTFGTKRASFYIKESLLNRIYNFAYWDRHSVTEAINIIVEDGLKGKNTKNKPS